MSQHNNSIPTESIIYILVGIITLTLTLFLLPIDDDWFFLKYFPGSNAWGIEQYKWLNNNILLIRDYWRPIEDYIMTFETSHPQLFPGLQHTLIVTMVFTCGWLATRLAVKVGADNHRSIIVMTIGILMATNLGAITSIDSLTQVSAALWGLLSINLLASKLKMRHVLWALCGALACVSKESGCVFFVCGPLYLHILERHNSGETPFQLKSSKSTIFCLCTAIALTAVYLCAYLTMHHINGDGSTMSSTILSAPVELDSTVASEFTRSQQSHALTPETLLKNLAILYGLGAYPVAVSGFYYGNLAIIIITLLLGWSGPVLLIRMWKAAGKSTLHTALALLALAFIISFPSLVTRAGEISPFNSNMLILAAVCVLAGGYKFKSHDKCLLLLFILATLTTDGYKYSLAYRGGVVGNRMAKEIVRLSPEKPEKVLWIGVDESVHDRAGAAYTKSPYRAFSQGFAAIKEYNYEYPKKLYKYYVSESPDADAKVDSIAASLAPQYDCVWITRGDSVRVISRTDSRN
jgi:hypothetical protein